MSTETMIFFGVSGMITLIILKAVIVILNKFIELTRSLGMLIEVTYHATHDPDFEVILNGKGKSEEEEVKVQ